MERDIFRVRPTGNAFKVDEIVTPNGLFITHSPAFSNKANAEKYIEDGLHNPALFW